MVPLRKLAFSTLVVAFLSPMASACGDLEIHSVYAALDGTGSRRRTSFFTDTTSIYCDADYASSRMDITFNAVIRQVYDANKVSPGAPVPQNEPGSNTDVIMALGEISPGIGHGVLNLQWTRPMDMSGSGDTLPFPAGWYRCEYLVDGIDPKTGYRAGNAVIQGKASFRVDYINCPVAGVTAGTTCKGYVGAGAGACKGTDASKSYKCDDASGKWVPL